MNKYSYVASLIFAFVGIGTLFTRHYGWYNEYWYTDVILHTVSGIGFGCIWFGLNKTTHVSYMGILGAISFATFGSVLWEFWEYAGWHIVPSHARYYIPELGDTLSDIFCGLCGGALSPLITLVFRGIRKK